MTKKHFKAVAEIIRNLRPEAEREKEYLIESFARLFEAENPRFDYDKFAKACKE